MTTRGALATAVIQATIVVVAFAISRAMQWRHRHTATTIRIPMPADGKRVIDLTNTDDSVTAR